MTNLNVLIAASLNRFKRPATLTLPTCLQHGHQLVHRGTSYILLDSVIPVKQLLLFPPLTVTLGLCIHINNYPPAVTCHPGKAEEFFFICAVTVTKRRGKPKQLCQGRPLHHNYSSVCWLLPHLSHLNQVTANKSAAPLCRRHRLLSPFGISYFSRYYISAIMFDKAKWGLCGEIVPHRLQGEARKAGNHVTGVRVVFNGDR